MNYLIDTVYDTFPYEVIQVSKEGALRECHDRLEVHDLRGLVSIRWSCDNED